MNAAIFLKDKFDNKFFERVENFTFDIDKDKLNTVKARLIELQKGYCQNEKPKINLSNVTLKDKVYKAIFSESDSDFFYVAILGAKFKK